MNGECFVLVCSIHRSFFIQSLSYLCSSFADCFEIAVTTLFNIFCLSERFVSLKISSNNVCNRLRNSSSKKVKLLTGIFGWRGSPISITGE